MIDILQNNSELSSGLIQNGKLNVNAKRPFIAEDGNAYISNSDKSGVLRVNAATLRRDEWKRLDEMVIKIAQSRLIGINDLRSAGLVYPLGNAMGTTVLERHKMSDIHEAVLSMNGDVRGKNDRPEYSTVYTPIPIVHVDYEIGLRALEASRNLGNPLDTTNAEMAARKVAEKLESMLFTNTTYAFGGGTIYSYINLSGRETVSLGTSWAATGSTARTGQQILDQVLTMKQKMLDNYKFGPYVLYVPAQYETKLDSDYDTSGQSTQTIKERLQKISGILKVQVVDQLPDDNVVLVQMTSDVVRLIDGMGIQNVEWGSEGGLVKNYKVMTIQIPELATDFTGKSGIVHLA